MVVQQKKLNYLDLPLSILNIANHKSWTNCGMWGVGLVFGLENHSRSFELNNFHYYALLTNDT